VRIRKLKGELDPFDGSPDIEVPPPSQIMAEARVMARSVADSTGEDFAAVWERFRATALRTIDEYHGDTRQ
jgi:hypothetical protein